LLARARADESGANSAKIFTTEEAFEFAFAKAGGVLLAGLEPTRKRSRGNRLRRPMEIVCDAAIGQRFREIGNLFAQTQDAARRGDFDEVWNELSPALLAAKTQLGKTIRKQLEFDPQLGGGELSLISPLSSLFSAGAPQPGPASASAPPGTGYASTGELGGNAGSAWAECT
jgi:hypothetical protein